MPGGELQGVEQVQAAGEGVHEALRRPVLEGEVLGADAAALEHGPHLGRHIGPGDEREPQVGVPPVHGGEGHGHRVGVGEQLRLPRSDVRVLAGVRDGEDDGDLFKSHEGLLDWDEGTVLVRAARTRQGSQ